MTKRLRDDPERLKEIIGKPSESFINAINRVNERMVRYAEMISNFIEQDFEEFRNKYELLEPDMRRWLREKEGYAHIDEPKKMYKRFLYVVTNEHNIDEMERSLERRDFIKIHRIIDRELEKSSLYSLINEFANLYSQHGKVKASPEQIETYIKNWVEYGKDNGARKERAKAKKQATEKCASLASFHDGSFDTWEEKWNEFYNERTTK